jgi:phosphoglycolate phosphatase-like HAD superfamily hydrolase
VGDSARELAAARALDARPVLVLTGNGLKTRDEMERRGMRVEWYQDLLAAARALVSEGGRAP